MKGALIGTEEVTALRRQLRRQLLHNTDSVLPKAVRLTDIRCNQAAEFHNRVIAGAICSAGDVASNLQLLDPAASNHGSTVICLGLEEIDIATDTPSERRSAGYLQADDKMVDRHSISHLPERRR